MSRKLQIKMNTFSNSSVKSMKCMKVKIGSDVWNQ